MLGIDYFHVRHLCPIWWKLVYSFILDKERISDLKTTSYVEICLQTLKYWNASICINIPYINQIKFLFSWLIAISFSLTPADPS